MDFIEKVKGFLIEPAKTFDAVKEDSLEETIKYYAIIAAINSALSAVLLAFAGALLGSMMGFRGLGMIMMGVGAGAAILFFIESMILVIIGAFIGGAILHIFVYLLGGRKGIEQTIKAVMYGLTPLLLLGWIPIIGFIATIWSLVLEILGIRQLQELTTGKAALAVLIPVIIAVIIAIVIAIIFAAIMFGIGGPYGRGY
ncbi:MAG: YIP1 family protein [Candidatus Methanoperedens sp.]|nr:YIP1 family protein [Candidatus Methanoperedens sp.]MCZ7369501.1 YIP1 family protein [Candidatus Methanoperedens sp.]